MPDGKTKTVKSFLKMKRDGEKIVMVTAYDAPMAAFAWKSGMDMLLVGDSVGMTTLGYKNTLPVTMDQMIHHCKAVRRGAPEAFVVGDMPFGSYHKGFDQALTNAMRFIQDADCDAVKLEVDLNQIDVVAHLVQSGIPVMGHIGLLTQRVKTCGGYKVVGRTEDDERRLIKEAKSLEEVGAFSMVLECVSARVAREVSESVGIPTIGIGAGTGCDGQVQVVHDLLGMFSDFLPKHAKRYVNLGDEIQKALSSYVREVKSGEFPTDANSF